MAILTLSSDQLKYDPLKNDSLGPKQFDPIGKEESKRVKTYNNDLGFALYPEEQVAVDAYKGQIDDAAGKQQGAIDQYRNQFNNTMSAANEQAGGILNNARTQVSSIADPSKGLVPVRVYTDGTLEGTYMLPRDTMETLSQNDFNGEEGHFASKWVDDGFNIDTRPVGAPHAYGAELHQALSTAAEQVKQNQSSYDAAIQAGNMQVGSLENSIGSQQELADAAYNQNINQANIVLNSIKGRWTSFLTDQQQAFQDGIRTNAGGIADLVNSGALIVTGTAGAKK